MLSNCARKDASLQTFSVQEMLVVICSGTLPDFDMREGSTYQNQLGILEQGSVDVELSHVVDDDSTANTLTVC